MAKRAATKSKSRTASKTSRTSTARRTKTAKGRASTAGKSSRKSTGRSTTRRRSGPRGFAMSITPALAKFARQMSAAIEEMAGAPSDAIALLKQDHREVEAMFKEFEELDSKAEKGKLAAKICLMLTVHATIEEELLYPQAHEEIEEDLVDEAIVEHASAKQLIAEIEAMSPGDHLFDAKVKVLGEYIKHHVKEEEGEMFPQLRSSDIDLEALGEQLTERKTRLLEQLSAAKR
jgi:hemerythrin superfamily protein